MKKFTIGMLVALTAASMMAAEPATTTAGKTKQDTSSKRTVFVTTNEGIKK